MKHTPKQAEFITEHSDAYKREGLMDYPGKRVEGGFITTGSEVIRIPDDGAEALEHIDRYLAAHNYPTIAERIPVVAYGANASPGSLATKFDKYSTDGTAMTADEMRTVPCIPAQLRGSDVVWHGRPGQGGGYFAELYHGPEVTDTDVEVVVEFLTPEQLAVLHTTEGETYGVATIEGVHLADDLPDIEAVAYLARDASVLLDANGEIVSVAGVKRSGAERPEWTVREALSYTLGMEAVQRSLGALTPEGYQAQLAGQPLSAKKAVQRDVHEALVDAGASRAMRHSLVDTQAVGRANFTSLPRGLQPAATHHEGPVPVELMEASIARIRPSAEAREARIQALRAAKPERSLAAIRQAVDPAERLRAQLAKELRDPARAEALALKFAARQKAVDDRIDTDKEAS